GAALTRQALALARGAGATAAFLQVERANAGALALYEGLGFAPVDRYHYRERPRD
ncbi:GNAT family N-acetyltransferase, partial [Streptococcus pyogenes]|uniref:GNAT family N-acetyltransferase n=1 Tax=Streptococcus pyogenes TaxID=1314 RepID=UPI003DA0C3D6